MDPFKKVTICLWVGGQIHWTPHVRYQGGTEHQYENVEIDEICYLDFFDWYKKATGEDATSIDVYYIHPNEPLETGVRLIKGDASIRELQTVHLSKEVVHIWIEAPKIQLNQGASIEQLNHGTQLNADQWGENQEELNPKTRDGGDTEEEINQEDSDTEPWMAEDFEAAHDDDIFVERSDDHEIQEYKKFRESLRKEALKDKAMREARKARRARAQINETSSQAGPSSETARTVNYVVEETGWFTDEESGSEDELNKKCMSDDENELNGYEEWKAKNYPDMSKFELTVGMMFPCRGVFREVLRDWVVRNGWDLELKKCEAGKISATCKEGCDWYVYASKLPKTNTFQVKRLRGIHECSAPKVNTQATYKYIGKRLLEKFRDTPDMDIEKMKRKIYKKLKISPSNHIIYRARRYALELINGDKIKEFERLWDYIATVCKENPGSQLEMKLNKELDPPKFERMFFGLKALMDGFKAGCRPIIGLDGCFLKGCYKGQLLSAVGRDANDNLYLIAMAYVGTESYHTWKWFLDILLREIGSYEDNGWAFISDRQKGLLDAVEELAPGAEHRFCLRHMYNNFKAKFRGLDMKRLFWRAASVCTVGEFNDIMKEINDTYPQVEENEVTPYVWLNRIEPKHWARCYFPTRTKCCSLVNNMSESFNNYILGARDLPIISMWEWIRSRVMSRIQVKLQGMQNYEGNVCPNIIRKMKKEWKEYQRYCFATFAGGDKYQVEFFSDCLVVKLDEMTCSCGMYQLRGIPCVHTIAAIEVHRRDWERYVDPFYRKDKYLATYSHLINPVPGMRYFEQTGKGPIQPPDIPVKIGRPQKKRRKDGNDTGDPTKASRKGQAKTCSKCLGYGHNYLTCKNPISQNSKYYQEFLRAACPTSSVGGEVLQGPSNSKNTTAIKKSKQGVGATNSSFVAPGEMAPQASPNNSNPSSTLLRRTPTWIRKLKTKPARSNIYVVAPPRRAPTTRSTTQMQQVTLPLQPMPPPTRIKAQAERVGKSGKAIRKQTTPKKRQREPTFTSNTAAQSSSTSAPKNPPPKKYRQHKLTIAEVLKNIKERKRGPPPV